MSATTGRSMQSGGLFGTPATRAPGIPGKRVLVAMVTAAWLLAACGADGHDHEAASGHQADHGGSVEVEEVRRATYGQGASASEATRTVEVTMSDDLRFTPGEIQVEKGEIVTFRITNLGNLTHDFTIGGPDAQRLHELEMAMGGGGEMASAGPTSDPGGMDHGSMDHGSMDHGSTGPSHDPTEHMGEDRSAAAQARRITELRAKVAFFTSVHVMPGETKEVTWALTGPRAPRIGCHVPGHWRSGMRASLIWS